MNHLFIQTAFLGDLLLSIPVLKQIKHWDPGSHLSLICRRGFGSFMENLGVCDQVFEFDKDTKSLTDQRVLKKEFDYIFCPHLSLTSHRLVQRIHSKNKLGYHRLWNRCFFHKRIHRRLDWPEAIRQMQLLAAVWESMELRLETFSKNPHSIPQWARMSLPHLHWTGKQYDELVEKKNMTFKLDQNYVCLAPGSVWPTKRWSEDGFFHVITRLVEKGLRVVLIGASEEKPLTKRLQAEVSHCYSLAGDLDLVESTMVLARSQGLVCNDSGAMHMAGLLELPTLAFFGPTVPQLGYKPWNPKAFVFEVKNLLCRPCGQHGSRSCPIGTHQCMTSIDADLVFLKAMEFFSLQAGSTLG